MDSRFQPSTALFWGVHVAAVIMAIVFFSWQGVLLAIGSYFVRMVLVTAAYHRYFSHRAFKTSRAFQFLLALGAQSSAQKGVSWWAAPPPPPSQHSDTENDIHSARRSGFWHSHIGWILGRDRDETDAATGQRSRQVPRAAHPQPQRRDAAAGVALACRLLPAGRLAGADLGLLRLDRDALARIVLDQLAVAPVRQAALRDRDDSRNNWALAIITTGEGWHNNHHHYQSSANQGFRWWEIDVTFYVLRVLALFGLIWDLRRPSPAVIAGASA